MKKIRMSTFETNSSSVHSIVIPRKDNKPTIKKDKFIFSCEGYGWEFDTHDFANYLWTAILYIHGYEENNLSIENWKTKIKNVLSPYYEEVIFEEPLGDYDCYIDHGFELGGLLDILYENEDLLLNAIMDGTVFTGNDNVYPEDNIYKETIDSYEEDEDNYFVYRKYN